MDFRVERFILRCLFWVEALNRKVLLEIYVSSTKTMLPVVRGNPPHLKNKMHTGDFKVALQIDFSQRLSKFIPTSVFELTVSYHHISTPFTSAALQEADMFLTCPSSCNDFTRLPSVVDLRKRSESLNVPPPLCHWMRFNQCDTQLHFTEFVWVVLVLWTWIFSYLDTSNTDTLCK